MLVEQLALAYKCHNSIGNSTDLKEMISEVLKTFVSESYAIYSEFLVKNEDGNFEMVDSFGKRLGFDSSKYMQYLQPLNLIFDDVYNLKILKLNLENGILFLVSKNSDTDCSFFVSMFESLIPKLNISVNACINFQKLEKTNELLKEQKKELIKANKTKDDFLANMSHELKTPLNSITVISSIMVRNKDNKLDDSQLRNMKIIKKCSEDLLILINDILDISKIEAGVLQIHPEDINLKNLLDELFDSFEELTTQKNIELKKEYIAQNFNLQSDEKRVSQIIKNFLTNAIKFTNKGSVTIKLEEFEEHYKIDVIDTGIGISKENLLNIFDRFKQVDDSTTRKYGGTGLGLAISKELASMLNSQLKVSSQIGEGSTFSLIIPKIFSMENKIEDEFENKQIEESKTNRSIFIFHSNSVVQFKLSVGLKKFGFDVHPIFNIQEFDLKVDSLNYSNNLIFIIDGKIENIDEIIKKCKDTKIDLVIIGENKNSEEVLFLKDDSSILDELKNYLLTKQVK